jgi:hypothetical protein
MSFFNMYYSAGWNDSDVKSDAVSTSLVNTDTLSSLTGAEKSSSKLKNKFGSELEMKDPTLYKYEEDFSNNDKDNSDNHINDDSNANNNINDDSNANNNLQSVGQQLPDQFHHDNNFNKFFLESSEYISEAVVDDNDDMPDFLKFAIPMPQIIPMNRKMDIAKTSYASAKFS